MKYMEVQEQYSDTVHSETTTHYNQVSNKIRKRCTSNVFGGGYLLIGTAITIAKVKAAECDLFRENEVFFLVNMTRFTYIIRFNVL